MKKASDIKSVAVIGAGVMGSGIALTALQAGYETLLFEINEATLKKAVAYISDFLEKSVAKGKLTAEKRDAMLSRFSTTGDLAAVKADFVIEAIPENLELKRKIFAQVQEQNPEDTILASNTSTIPITRIGAGLKRPQNLVGLHFFNPAPLMKLVEVIAGEMTAPEVTQLTLDIASVMDKTAVLTKDEPGFIVNRVARHFYLESLKILEEGVASHETIDMVMMNSGFRMGPFQLMDLIGVETNHEVTKSLYEAFFQDEKFRPSRVQQKKVDAGHFGRKTGKGFYSYENVK